MLTRLSGVYTVLPTPFDENGAVDRESLRSVIELFLGDGVSGFTALGVTSEVARLSDAERQMVLETTMASVNGRVPVIVGATGSGLDTCLGYCAAARDAGAAGVMVSPPRMPKLNSAYVHRHFAGIAEKFDFAIVIQDYPPISGYHLEASLLVDLCRKSSARTIKLEDAPTPEKTARIRSPKTVNRHSAVPGRLLIEDSSPEPLSRPASSPQDRRDRLRDAGKKDEAADFFYRHVPLMRFEFQEGIGMAIRKEMLRRRGALTHAGIRPPGATLDRSTMDTLERILKWFELD
jgi:4-hydroxy-tetrahydrodipicolinate synthase